MSSLSRESSFDECDCVSDGVASMDHQSTDFVLLEARTARKTEQTANGIRSVDTTGGASSSTSAKSPTSRTTMGAADLIVAPTSYRFLPDQRSSPQEPTPPSAVRLRSESTTDAIRVTFESSPLRRFVKRKTDFSNSCVTWLYECELDDGRRVWENRDALWAAGYDEELQWFDLWLNGIAAAVEGLEPPPLPPFTRTAGYKQAVNLCIKATSPAADNESLSANGAYRRLDFDALFPDMEEFLTTAFGKQASPVRFARCDLEGWNATFAAIWRRAIENGENVAPVRFFGPYLTPQGLSNALRHGLFPCYVPEACSVPAHWGSLCPAVPTASFGCAPSAKFRTASLLVCVGLVGQRKEPSEDCKRVAPEFATSYNGRSYHCYTFPEAGYFLPVWVVDYQVGEARHESVAREPPLDRRIVRYERPPAYRYRAAAAAPAAVESEEHKLPPRRPNRRRLPQHYPRRSPGKAGATVASPAVGPAL